MKKFGRLAGNKGFDSPRVHHTKERQMAIDIGRIAYEAYTSHTLTSQNIRGDKLRKWEEIGQEQNAWRHAACAVLKYIDQAKQDIEDGVIG